MIFVRGSELVRERLRRPPRDMDVRAHAKVAVEWLGAAQDTGDDSGVSHSYLIGERWMRSYPETTGYIIPTMLNWSEADGDPDAVRRALQMADWELETQLEDGAVPDLVAGDPVIFDAGQVLFGFVAANRQTGEDRYLEGARKAASWLLQALDEDGVWRSGTDSGGPGRVYNARTAWAVLEFAALTGDGSFEGPMRRFLDWALGMERKPGWFDRNCLTEDSAPLLHTIAYTARGLLECGLLLDDSRYVEASRRTARKLLEAVGKDGRMAGRFGPDFRPTVGWACLTGMAQMSIVWRRHSLVESSAEFDEAAFRVNRFLMRTQDVASSNPGLRGGIRGSFPVNGAYGRWRVLNWATKFFVDALMVEMDPGLLRYRG
jgi:hypothetical protein